MSHNDHHITGPTTAWDVVQTPLGPLTMQASEHGLTGLVFPGHAEALDDRDRDRAALAEATRQLESWFAGERQAFDLPLDLAGTPFQRRVWDELLGVPYGDTITYGELARRVGRADIVRAVGAAVGRTPAPIVIPCHRVLGADGSLTGYRGGLQRKRALLDHERRGRDGRGPEPAWAVGQLAML
jgi:methylated-DNA-[protein]-cysteine S-methyltransferase